ncbi:MAG: S1-like domain-containing RNA-binding protein [Desulforhopalus sp.]
MVQIGKINKLPIKTIQEASIYLDGGQSGKILLKGTQIPRNYRPDDTIDVFVYVARDQQLVATTRRPSALVGDFAKLRVVTSSATGAFLDWGLDHDLFAPKSEQQDSMLKGRSYVVYIFLSEKNNRITASSKLHKFLGKHPPEYEEGEEVDLMIYSRTDLGYSAIVNSSHDGMIYDNEVFQKLFIGQQLKGYIKKIREDLKIDLSLQQTGYKRVDDISQTILNTIRNSGGKVAVTDKSPPEEIYSLFGVSKKVFKKAIGALYKKRLIIIDADGIKLVR